MAKTKANNKKYVAGAAPVAARPFKLWQDDSVNQDARIEIIPLIDVIFCILTFFILASVSFSRQQAISLDLPKAKTGSPQMREMLMVTLDDFGQIYIEKQPISNKDQLYQVIGNYTQLNPTGLMVLHAGKNASYKDVVEVLDILRDVGGDRVALATLPGESAMPQPTEKANPSNPYDYSNLGLPGNNNVNPNTIPNVTPNANPTSPNVTPNLTPNTNLTNPNGTIPNVQQNFPLSPSPSSGDNLKLPALP